MSDSQETVERVPFELVLVSHDASLTGAPEVLGSFARWIAATHPGRHRIVSLRGGPRLAEFDAALPTWTPRGVRVIERCAPRARSTAAHSLSPFRSLRGDRRPRHVPRVWWSNTLASLAWTSARAAPGDAIVCHVHELDGVAARILDPSRRRRLLAAADLLVAVSDQVAAMLVERWGVPSELVCVIPDFVDAPAGTGILHLSSPRSRRIVGVGAVGERKGVDEFVEVLAELDADDVEGWWFGPSVTAQDERAARASIERLGLTRRVVIAGPVREMGEVWRRADVHLVTAREDPSPLAPIHAALNGVPTVATEFCGRGSWLADVTPNMVAPIGDVVALARLCGELLDDPASAARAAAAQFAVASTVLTTEIVAPQLWAVAERAASLRAGSPAGPHPLLLRHEQRTGKR